MGFVEFLRLGVFITVIGGTGYVEEPTVKKTMKNYPMTKSPAGRREGKSTSGECYEGANVTTAV